MVAIPPALLDIANLTVGGQVAVSVEAGRLVIERQKQPKYTLAELLAQCNPNAPMRDEDQAWVFSGAVGLEEI
jgi:antitoxin ChpS